MKSVSQHNLYADLVKGARTHPQILVWRLQQCGTATLTIQLQQLLECSRLPTRALEEHIRERCAKVSTWSSYTKRHITLRWLYSICLDRADTSAECFMTLLQTSAALYRKNEYLWFTAELVRRSWRHPHMPKQFWLPSIQLACKLMTPTKVWRTLVDLPHVPADVLCSLLPDKYTPGVKPQLRVRIKVLRIADATAADIRKATLLGNKQLRQLALAHPNTDDEFYKTVRAYCARRDLVKANAYVRAQQAIAAEREASVAVGREESIETQDVDAVAEVTSTAHQG